MTNHHHHYHHYGYEVPPWAMELDRKLDLVLEKLEIVMSLETDALDKLEASATAMNSAEDSAEASFTALAALIAGLKNNQTDPATAARITAAADALKARADRLAAAVVAHTPAAAPPAA